MKNRTRDEPSQKQQGGWRALKTQNQHSRWMLTLVDTMGQFPSVLASSTMYNVVSKTSFHLGLRRKDKIRVRHLSSPSYHQPTEYPCGTMEDPCHVHRILSLSPSSSIQLRFSVRLRAVELLFCTASYTPFRIQNNEFQVSLSQCQ